MNPKVDFSSDWRFNDGQMHARQFCLNAFIQHRINLTRDGWQKYGERFLGFKDPLTE